MFFLTLLAFVVILGLLIFVHEAGHFIVAKLSGVKVEEFAFGFPPRLFGFQVKRKRELKELVTHEEIKTEIEDIKSGSTEKIRETITENISTTENSRTRWDWKFAWGPRSVSRLLESGIKNDKTTYAINLIPFGGYVKMLGEEKNSDSPRAFNRKKPKIRFGIVVAGVVMNFILAGFLLSIGYMIGMPPIRLNPEKIGGTQVHQVVIAQINDGSSAQKADLRVGDLVLGYGSVEDFSTFTRENLGESIDLSLKRDGQTLNKVVEVSQNEQAPLGVGIVDVPIIKLGFFKAIYAGFVEMGLTTGYITVMLGRFIGDLFHGKSVADEVAGPIGIFNVTGQAVKMGFTYIVQLAALLSINLGLINILPIPALDGGRAVLIAAEAVARRKVIREEIENIMHTVGFAILVLLILLISAKEVIGLF